MNFARQIQAVTAMNLRSLPQRAGTSLVVVVGIAGVVAVLISVLSLATGLSRTLATTGRAERVIVLSSGQQAEVGSSLSRDAALTIMDAPGIRRDSAGKPIASAEVMDSVWLPKRNADGLGSVTFRGVGTQATQLRPEIKIIEGRAFQAGLREILVGRTTQSKFKGLDLGSRVAVGGNEWQVVGVFTSNGDVHESELLTDAATLLSASKRSTYNSVTAWLESAGSFDTLKNSLTTNPTLSVEVRREPDYYEQQSKQFGRFLSLTANVIATIMAIGAIFGALNTMYSAVSARAVEIATLRAIGFGASGVIASVLAEALLLAIFGALLGTALAWLFFNGMTVSTISGGSVSQVVFHLRIGLDLVVLGIVWACIVGMIGGLFPAIRAARLPVAMALRAI